MTVATLATGVLVALAVGLVLQPVVLRMMAAAGVLDPPSARSSHTIATPRGGGAAVVAAAAAGLVLVEPARGFMVPLLLFAAIGLLEDLRGVAVTSRLVLQAGAGTAAALVLLRGVPAGAPASAPTAGLVLLVAMAAVWFVAYANAFNFMDGINGISAGHAMLAGTVYAAVGLSYQLPALTAAGAVAAVAAATFLPWNAGRARIFLGDVGSYGLGGLLGALAAYGWWQGVPAELALAPLALYLADTGWTLLRRCWRGEAWYRPHRSHAYQRLTDLGWSHQRVTVITALTSLAVCGCAVTAAGSGLPTRIALDVLAVAILVAYLASPWALRSGYLRQQAGRDRSRYQERGVHA